MSDFELDRTTWDLSLEGADFNLISGVDDVAQELAQRIYLWRSEWFLDERIGTDYLGRILGKSDQSVRDAEFKRQISGPSRVSSITQFLTEFDRTNRVITVDFEVEAEDETDPGVTKSVSAQLDGLNPPSPGEPTLVIFDSTGII